MQWPLYILCIVCIDLYVVVPGSNFLCCFKKTETADALGVSDIQNSNGNKQIQKQVNQALFNPFFSYTVCLRELI